MSTKIAVFGLGSAGMRHVRNLIELGEQDLFGCDLRVGQEGFSVENTHMQATNFADLIWKWNPEVVLICTPPESHYELAFDALKRGVSVFIEKPITVDVEEARCLRDMALLGHRHLAVGFQIRFSLAFFAASLLPGSDLTMVCAQDMATWPSRYDKDPLAEFSHEIASATFLKGPVVAVTARHTPGIWNLTLRHLKGYTDISLAYAEKAPRRLYTASNGAKYTWGLEENNEAYRTELRAFLSVCQGAPWDDRLCSGAEAVHITRILDAARQSDREFCVVQP